jgi:hypothetical protein
VVAVAVGVEVATGVEVAVAVWVGVAVVVAVVVAVEVDVAVAVRAAVDDAVAVWVAVTVGVGVAVEVAVAVIVAVRVAVADAVAVTVAVGLTVAVRVAVAVAEAVGVAVVVALRVAVAVDVAVRVAVGVGVAVGVRVSVAVGVELAVAVAVSVGVAVAVGVGRLCFLAEPVNVTLANRAPAVASLWTLMLAEKRLPGFGGANSTVMVAAACGWIVNAPCPDAILKHGLPLGGSTVTDSSSPPAFLIVKDFVSVTVWPERLILLKASRVGVTASLLTGTLLLTLASLTWACALAANKSATATINDAIVVRHPE